MIAVIFCLRGCAGQTCDYDINKFMNITCYDIISFEEIKNNISTTLDEYHSAPWLITFLELKNCELPDLNMNTFRFLPELTQIHIINSNITKLSYEEVND